MSYSFKRKRGIEKCYENNSGCQTHLAWGIQKVGGFFDQRQLRWSEPVEENHLLHSFGQRVAASEN